MWQLIACQIVKLYKIKEARSVNFKILFWCLQTFQKTNEIFSRILVLTPKKISNKKEHFILLIEEFYFDYLIYTAFTF